MMERRKPDPVERLRRMRLRTSSLLQLLTLSGLILATVLVIEACKPEQRVADLVRAYCVTFTQSERAALRARVAEAVAPHRITIDCEIPR